MKYVSTRGRAPALEFVDVLLVGLASDGGLYVPESWPQFSLDAFFENHGVEASYATLAIEVMWPFVEGSIERDKFSRIVVDAYSIFEHPDVVPLVDLGENRHLLELFHGPTLAFKDIALQLAGRLFASVLEDLGERATILVATSGDTGSAAIEAVRDHKSSLDIVVLHPHDKTSLLQRRQMTTVDEPNVHNIAIEGTFDDCQDLVKSLLADESLRSTFRLSAMNSINWARVMAQIVYYWWAALQLQRLDAPVAFAVPTGNFGNVFAGFCARRMGLEVEQLVVGSNRNDALTRFFTSGMMTIENVEPSLSPSMDIQIPSNFERLLFELFARDGEVVTDLLSKFRSKGSFAVDVYRLGALREVWDAACLDDDATIEVIAAEKRRSGQMIDPHTAVGLGAAERCRRSLDVPMVSLATAHPAKFPDVIELVSGFSSEMPERLAAIIDLPENYDILPNDFAIVKAHVSHLLQSSLS